MVNVTVDLSGGECPGKPSVFRIGRLKNGWFSFMGDGGVNLHVLFYKQAYFLYWYLLQEATPH